MDITHGIERYGVRQGALVLRNTLPYMPVGVHVAVVDPQVGTERRALALRTGDGRILVGPDNGLLSLALGALRAASIWRSTSRARRTGSSRSRPPSTAATSSLRWRAQLARGAELADAGDPLDPDDARARRAATARVRRTAPWWPTRW